MTEEIAYVFPGQGAQYQGMGKDFFDNFEEAKRVYNFADKILNKNVSKICFEGTDEELKQTVNTQPCIVATESGSHRRRSNRSTAHGGRRLPIWGWLRQGIGRPPRMQGRPGNRLFRGRSFRARQAA